MQICHQNFQVKLKSSLLKKRKQQHNCNKTAIKLGKVKIYEVSRREHFECES